MTSTSLRTLTLSVAASVALFNPAAGCLAQSQPTKRAVVTQPAKDESLRRELLKMLDDDQAVRQRLIDAKMQGEALAREQQTLDAANTKRLQEIFKTRGFPGAALVGKDGVGAVVVMLLHSPSLELQRMALPHVERAARRGEVPPDSFALLTDDVLNAEGKPQLYGTNFDIKDGKLALAKTQDPARLDARRRKLHLIPIREYAKFLAEMYKMPVDEASLPSVKAGKRDSHIVQPEVPEVVFLGSVLQRISPRITLLRTRLDPSWAKEQVTSSSDGAFDAFTIEQPTSRTRYGVNVRDRIFISLRKTGDVYEILGLPEEHRPYSYLRWEGNHLFVFDRWASPHHGIRYKLDARRKKILSARAFIEADYIERQKRVSRNR